MNARIISNTWRLYMKSDVPRGGTLFKETSEEVQSFPEPADDGPQIIVINEYYGRNKQSQVRVIGRM